MPKTAQELFNVTDLDGQFLQSTGVKGEGDNFRTFTDREGYLWEDVSSRTVHTTIADIRNMGGTREVSPNKNVQYLTGDYNCPGVWVLDENDSISEDNTGTTLVTSDGKRLKRKFDGSVNAKWFGVTTGGWQSVNLQKALDVAHDLGVDRFLYHDQTILLNETVYIPENTALILGCNTLIRGYTPTMFNIRNGGLIKGGIVYLGKDAGANKGSLVGIFFWGGYNYTQGQRKTGVYGTEIRGEWRTGQKGVRFAVGTDEDGNAIESNDGQSIAFVTFNGKINNCEYGISSEILGVGDGYINGIDISGFITATKNYISGSSWTISAQVQTQIESKRPGFDSYYAFMFDRGAGNHFVYGRIWDWVATENNPYAIIINNTNNIIFSNIGTFSGNADRYILDNGHNNRSNFYNPYGVTPPTAFINSRDCGSQDDWFLFADKKYKITCSTSDDITNVFRQNILNGVNITAHIEQSITIESRDGDPISLYPRFIGISMSASNFAEKIKIEYKDDNEVWHLIFTNLSNNSYDIFSNNFLGMGMDRVFSVRFSFSSSKGVVNIKRLWFFAIGNPESFLPCGGGKIYGDLILKEINNSKLGTDADGKIVSINDIINELVKSDLTNSDLNTLYPNALKGQKIICPNIEGGAQAYTLYDDVNKLWFAENIQLL